MSQAAAHAAPGAHAHAETHHEELPFWRKYIFSVDHKMIGLQYGFSALAFLLFGFTLMMIMRWSMAHPDQPVPFVGRFLSENGALTPELYNAFGAMHGTIMVFMGVVPLADLPGAGPGQTYWLVGMVFLITSSLLGSINFIVTVIQLRAEGLSWFRLPFFVWAQFVTSFLLLLAFPPLEAAGVMQLMDRVAGTSFFLPTGMVVGTAQYTSTAGVLEGYNASGGGSPLLWQHLFWFLAHPEVYVLILPAFGILAEVITCNTRKPLFGYRSMVYSIIFLGFTSFIVWAHHMFMTGMGSTINAFFQTTTMIISIPSVIILGSLFISLWGGSIRFNTPMLFALGFLPMFGIGGLTGLPLGLSYADIPLHDTYYVIGHFHYVVAPGTIFALFAGIYHWYPKISGRRMNESLGKFHFWGSFICMNGIFFPMLIQGLMGVNRRLYDGGTTYADPAFTADNVYSHVAPVLHFNSMMAWSAWTMGLIQLVFIFNFFKSMVSGEKVDDNPWKATTLDWATPTPPPHGNFLTRPVVHRDAYEYSVPGHKTDFYPQHEA